MNNLKLYGKVLLSLILVIILLLSLAGSTNAIILNAFENNSSVHDISNSSKRDLLDNTMPDITNSSLVSQNNSSHTLNNKNREFKDKLYYEGLKHSLPKWQSKLSTDLLMLVNKSFLTHGDSLTSQISNMKKQNQFIAASSFPKNDVINKPQDDIVLVYVYVSRFANTSIVDDYAWYTLSRNEKEHYVVAYIEVKNLEKLASLDYVKSIRTVIPPESNSGSVNPLSDTILGTSQARSNYNINGSGISVGIISNGINNYTLAQSTGDLPPYPQFSILRYKPWPLWGTGDEGTAMAEVVYDIVPNATIYYGDPGQGGIYGDSIVDSANALASAGCNIIVDDWTFYDQPWFEDGGITNGLRAIYQTYPNVTLITSAGNFANQSYYGDYFNDGTNSHDFSRGKSGDQRLHITLAPQGIVKIALQWNDEWGNSYNDYDLYLIDNQTGATVAQSTNTQNGQGSNPYEFIYYTNSGTDSKNYDIRVDNYNGLADTRTLKLLLHLDNGGINSSYFSSAGSIVEHNGMPEEITVGAIDEFRYYYHIFGLNASYYLESDSSQGPITLSYPISTIIPKPDISGLDGVEISTASSVGTSQKYDHAYRFFGTSAAAPGVAGILAQLESAHPNFTRDQYRSMLMASTGSSIQNDINGYGLVNASAMYPFASSYVNDTIVPMVSRNQSYHVSVTMNNNWTTDWSAANGIVMAGLNDSPLFGVSNVSMDNASVVHPGENYTWNFIMTAPNQSGLYNLSFQLAWAGYAGGSGYALFGSVFSKSVNVSEAVYSTPGSYNFTVPPGITSLNVTLIGSGGGGGGAGGYNYEYDDVGGGGGGGGSGYVNIQNVSVISGSQYTVVVGQGGNGGNSTGNGQSQSGTMGGQSVFGSYAVNGGSPGTGGYTGYYQWGGTGGAGRNRGTNGGAGQNFGIPGTAGVGGVGYMVSGLGTYGGGGNGGYKGTSPGRGNSGSNGAVIIQYGQQVQPIASYITNVTSGGNPLTVQFNDTSVGSPFSWYWNFGDGTTSSQNNVTHTFSALGNYTVSLTVTNSVGNSTAQNIITVYPYFVMPGSYNFIVPSGVTRLNVTIVGGGGGGGGAGGYNYDYDDVGGGGGGGGSGYVTVQTISVIPGSQYTVVVGQGGNGGNSTGNGQSQSGTMGGQSIFGSYVANGGSPGTGGYTGYYQWGGNGGAGRNRGTNGGAGQNFGIPGAAGNGGAGYAISGLGIYGGGGNGGYEGTSPGRGNPGGNGAVIIQY